MHKVKVSVVIPVHNTQEYLKQCLDSVLKQTLDDIEVIIVNDCSPDASAAIIERYVKNDTRFTCVNHNVNKGLPKARNSGVLIAQGKYLIHLDSDDYWLDENTLTTLYQTAEIDGCDILRFNGLHHIKGKCSQPILESENIVNGSFKNNHQFWNYRSVFLYFFRKSFLDEFKLKFIEDLSLGEDAIFLSSALPRSQKISSIPNMFYAYRADNVSLMRKPWSLEDFIQEEKAARIISNNIKHVKGAFINYWSFRFSHYWSTKLMARAFNELNNDERQLLISFVSETVAIAEIDPEELKNNEHWSPIGEKVATFLLKKDVVPLAEYIGGLNTLSGSKPHFYFTRKFLSSTKSKLKPLSVKCYWKTKRISDNIRRKLAIRRIIASFHLKDKVFSNIEGRSDYNFTLSKKGKSRGISAMLRVKNEEKYIVGCLESIVELFDEISVIDNGSTDSTTELVKNFKHQHPLGQRVTLHSYPFSVAKCGAEHQATMENSLKSLAYYYNWCISRCRYSMICKWDADMLLSSKMSKREIFKRYILSLVHARRWTTGSIPLQTVYIDKANNKFISQDEINEEVRIFPNIPAVYFVKDKLWEVLKMTFAIHNKRFEAHTVYELKDVKQDEFSHWSSETFTGDRKVKEFRNYMYIKKSMHLSDPHNFLMSDIL